MWDVKYIIYIDNKGRIKRFYLNYVGCKVCLIYYSTKKEKRFTLTMWDVKVLKNRSGLSDVDCFTLTMWDVKDAFSNFAPIEISVLP